MGSLHTAQKSEGVVVCFSYLVDVGFSIFTFSSPPKTLFSLCL